MSEKEKRSIVGSLKSSNDLLTRWAREKLAVLHKEEPVIRVLMYPAAEQNPYLLVMRDNMERLGARVTMLHDLDSSELIRQAPLNDVLHVFNIEEYRSPFSSEDLLQRSSRISKRIGRMWIAKRMGLKIFWTLYNEPRNLSSSDWLEKNGRMMMYQLADRIVAPSRATRRLIREHYPKFPSEKVLLMPHHNFGDYFPKQVRRWRAHKHLGIKPKGRVFICFGGIHPYKGLTDIIPLFGKHPLRDHTLIVAGNPSNKHYATTIEGLCSRYDNVHAFLRFIPPDEVQYYMHAADVFVMPYKDVLNSGSTMLALSFGKPLVAPTVGMIPEIVNPSCAILFEQAGGSQLRAALIKALDLNIERAGAEARRIADSFSAEGLTRKQINAYLEYFPKRKKLEEEAEEI